MTAHKTEPLRDHAAQFQRGIDQFNAGRFFDAHETWEEVWLASAEPQKSFLQGIIQIAAAFHHYTHGNLRGTRSLLDAGLRRITPFPPSHDGIALELLRESARRWSVALASQEDPGAASVPRIQAAKKR